MYNLTNSGLYEDQEEVLYRSLEHFTSDSENILTFAASAGCGKTHTVRSVIQAAKVNGLQLSAGSFTGRACGQLGQDGIEASTLHSILLKPIIDEYGNLERWEDKDRLEILGYIGDGIILDEASFIPLDMYLKFVDLNVKILNVGDSGQLPSISSDEDGNSIEFNAMTDTSDSIITLTKNRRFDENSGIGKLATHLRRRNSIITVDAEDVRYVTKKQVMGEMFHRSNQFDIVICGYNNTRHTLNALIRNARGYYDNIPEVGETVMCLRNNIIDNQKINNGELYTVEGVIKDTVSSRFALLSECGRYRHNITIMNGKWSNEDYPNPVSKKNAFGDFGFGYATTCHKAQGSTFKRVLVIDDDVSKFVDRRKWRYTAITRASEHLSVAV